jgi:hypothetical protein
MTSTHAKLALKSTSLEIAQVNQGAQEAVQQEYAAMEERGVYGRVNCDKPDNVVWMMYKNFSSLSLFQWVTCAIRKFVRLTS